MPKGPAARVGDPVSHPLPPVLTGAGSPTVRIGKRPAWRGAPSGGVPALAAQKQTADIAIQAAEAATMAAASSPGYPAAYATEQALKNSTSAMMAPQVMVCAGAADLHSCSTPAPIPPHGVGVVIDGSKTVRINGLPACRVGDTILETLGPPNKIASGEPTVQIGG